MTDVDIPAQAAKLRELQTNILRERPGHLPLVMCPVCGHTQFIPVGEPDRPCARGHAVTNPHFRSGPGGATPSDNETLPSLGDVWTRVRDRPTDTPRASLLRLTAVLLLYFAVIGAVFVGLRWLSR